MKFHYDLLKDEATQIKYNIELRSKFAALRTIDPYDNLVTSIDSVSKAVLGVKKRKKCPNWVSERTIKLQDERDKARNIFRRRKTIASRKIWKDLAEQVIIAYQKDETERINKQLAELEDAAIKNKLRRT